MEGSEGVIVMACVSRIRVACDLFGGIASIALISLPKYYTAFRHPDSNLVAEVAQSNLKSLVDCFFHADCIIESISAVRT